MKVYPTLEQAKELAATGNYGVIPVSTEIFADSTTTVEVLRRLKKVSRHVYLLKSAEADRRWGRYSFLGYDPVLELTGYNGEVTLTTALMEQKLTGNPREYIRHVLQEKQSPRLEGMPPFTGGLVGYFSCDYIKYSEPTLKLDAEDADGFKDVDLMLPSCSGNDRQRKGIKAAGAFYTAVQ